MTRTAARNMASAYRTITLALAFLIAVLGSVFAPRAVAAPIGDLPMRIEEAVSRHDDALAEFRVVLAAKRIATDGNLCSDPDLLRLIAKCVTEHQIATSAFKEMQSRTATETNLPMEDQRALDRASRLVNQLPPLHTSAIELAGAGGCDPYRVAINVDEQAASDEAERNRQRNEENAAFLDELLSDYAHDGPTDAASEPAQAEPEAEDETTPSAGAWDHAHFSELYLRYQNASNDLRRSATNFLDRLDLLSADGEEICHDQVLAYSYTEVQRFSVQTAVSYDAICSMVSPSIPASVLHSALMTPGSADLYSHLPVDDQLAFAQVASDAEKLLTVIEYIDAELAAKAEGCDKDELADLGRRTAEEGQDTESGIDAGAGVVEGGGPIDDGPLRFEKTGVPFRQDDDTEASCSGGSLTFEVGTVTFPDEVFPEATYTVSVPVTWTVSGGNVDDFTLGIAVWFLGSAQQTAPISQFSGSQTFQFTFSGSQAEFGQGAGVISIIVGGGITCILDGSDDASAAITQSYIRHGSE